MQPTRRTRLAVFELPHGKWSWRAKIVEPNDRVADVELHPTIEYADEPTARKSGERLVMRTFPGIVFE